MVKPVKSLMTISSAKSNLFLRFVASVMFFIWVAAVAACTMTCSCSDSERMAQTSTSANQAPDSQGSDKDCDQHDSFCHSLHSLTPVSTATIFTKPDFGLPLTLNFLSISQFISIEQSETSVPRQPPDRQFVFIPEVSLGAAFRSLAPPSFA
jgi:hypothetical protein